MVTREAYDPSRSDHSVTQNSSQDCWENVFSLLLDGLVIGHAACTCHSHLATMKKAGLRIKLFPYRD